MKKLLLIAFAALTFIACKKEETSTDLYQNGVFVLNQGLFGSGVGTLDFIERGSGVVNKDIYQQNNESQVLGNVLQSMIEFNDYYYFAVNNTAKIVVVNKEDMKFVASIAIDQPRFFATDGDRLYVSSWGDTGSNGAVYEIINDTELSAPIISGNGPEGMVINENKLYVAKGGGYGTDSTLVIIDMETNTEIQSITTGINPQWIEKTSNGDMYLICNGYSDFMNPENNIPGKLHKIVDDQIVNTIEFLNAIYSTQQSIAIDEDNEVIYYLGSFLVNKTDFDFSDNGNTIAFLKYLTTIAWDEEEDKLYGTYIPDFTSDAQLNIYENDVQVDSLTVGISPGFIYFN